MITSKSESSDELIWIKAKLSKKYKDQSHFATDYFEKWDENTKLEFVESLLSRMCHSQLRQVNLVLKPVLQRDFIGLFAKLGLSQISEKILRYLDADSLTNADNVSPSWRKVASSGHIWKNLIEERISTDSIWYYLIRKLGLLFYFDVPIRESNSNDFLDGKYDPISPDDPDGVWSKCSPCIIRASESTLPASGINTLTMNSLVSAPISRIQRAELIKDSDFYRELYPKLIFIIDVCFLFAYLLTINQRIKKNWRDGHVKIHRINCESQLNKGVYCLQYDDDKIVSGLRDNTIKIWDRVTLECRAVLRGHTGSVLCLQYDDCLIISGSSDATVRVWCVITGRQLSVLEYHREAVLHLRFNNRMLVTCSKDHSVAVWSIKYPTSITLLTRLIGHRAAINVVDFDDNYIVSASGDRTIKVWDTKTFQLSKTLNGHRRGIACLQYRDKLIVSGSSDNTIRLWDVEQGICLRTMEGHEELVRCIRMDSRYIVSGAYDGKIKVWDLQAALDPLTHPESLCIATLCEHTGRVFRLQFDEFQIVSSSHDDTIVIWDFFDMEPSQLMDIFMDGNSNTSGFQLLGNVWNESRNKEKLLCGLSMPVNKNTESLDASSLISPFRHLKHSSSQTSTIQNSSSAPTEASPIQMDAEPSFSPKIKEAFNDNNEMDSSRTNLLISLVNNNSSRKLLKNRQTPHGTSLSSRNHDLERRRVRSSSTISLLNGANSLSDVDLSLTKNSPSTSNVGASPSRGIDSHYHLSPQRRSSRSALRLLSHTLTGSTIKDTSNKSSRPEIPFVSQAPSTSYVTLTTKDPALLDGKSVPRGITWMNVGNSKDRSLERSSFHDAIPPNSLLDLTDQAQIDHPVSVLTSSASSITNGNTRMPSQNNTFGQPSSLNNQFP